MNTLTGTVGNKTSYDYIKINGNFIALESGRTLSNFSNISSFEII